MMIMIMFILIIKASKVNILQTAVIEIMKKMKQLKMLKKLQFFQIKKYLAMHFMQSCKSHLQSLQIKKITIPLCYHHLTPFLAMMTYWDQKITIVLDARLLSRKFIQNLFLDSYRKTLRALAFKQPLKMSYYTISTHIIQSELF